MSTTKMFVPDKIRVGYQKRGGTYTGKLAYVIYFDNKGKLRKESSWESWRDEKIDPADFTNEPTSGFVLNKGVGGTRESYGWDARNEYIRVYDPRDFEFEISVANLLFILQETSSIKGKGLEGEFVYAWDGTELVLLPVGCAEYEACTEHTKRQDKKVVAKDVKPGFSYLMKNGTNVMYLGRFPYNATSYFDKTGFEPCGLKHVFLDLDNPKPEYSTPYITDSGFTKLAESVSPGALPTYPDELERFQKSRYNGLVTSISIKDAEHPKTTSYRDTTCLLETGDDEYMIVNIISDRSNYYWGNQKPSGYEIRKSKPFKPELKDSALKVPVVGGDYEKITAAQFEKLVFKSLFVVNSKGTEIKVI